MLTLVEAIISLTFLQVVKSLVMAGVLLVVIPLLLGLLFDVIIVAPMRVPLDQSPIFFPWQVRENSFYFFMDLVRGRFISLYFWIILDKIILFSIPSSFSNKLLEEVLIVMCNGEGERKQAIILNIQ